MGRAADRAAARGTPWVLDPVGTGATAYRTHTARDLAGRKPSVVGRRLEDPWPARWAAPRASTDRGAEEAAGVARELARGLGCVVAVTGAVDYVTDGG